VDTGPDALLEQAKASARLHQALMMLKEDARAVVVLRHFSDLNYAQIAEILQIHEETVKSRLFSARRKLAELMQSRD
jgi:RNA polymerase sigma-70 factor (ECF subfamily)